jgi:hypothetical protein
MLYEEPFLTPEELEECECAPRPFTFEPDPEDDVPY